MNLDRDLQQPEQIKEKSKLLKGRKLSRHIAPEGQSIMSAIKYYFNIEVNVFYSFADIVALMGRPLSAYIAERLQTGLRIIGGWLKLPLITIDRSGINRVVRLKIRDWFGLEYTGLVNTALVYNVKMPHKGLMDGKKDAMHYVQFRMTLVSSQMFL